jgi:hypothetical protein
MSSSRKGGLSQTPTQTWQAKPTRFLARVLRVLLFFNVVLCIPQILYGWSYVHRLQHLAATLPILEKDSIPGLYPWWLPSPWTFNVVVGIVWLMWQYRGQANLEAMGEKGLRFTPRFAVVWWLVPLANLVMPYRVTVELWERLGPDERSRTTLGPLPAWWGAWVTSRIVACVGLAVQLSSVIPGENRAVFLRYRRVGAIATARMCFVFAQGMRVVAGILAILVTLAIDRRMESRISFRLAFSEASTWSSWGGPNEPPSSDSPSS